MLHLRHKNYFSLRGEHIILFKKFAVLFSLRFTAKVFYKFLENADQSISTYSLRISSALYAWVFDNLRKFLSDSCL